METWVVLVGVVGGAAVAASVPRVVSRRGTRAGWLAAAPLTPTLALLSVDHGIDWGSGLAVIAGATIGLVAPAVLRIVGVNCRPLPTMATFGLVSIVGLLYLASPIASVGGFAAALLVGRWAYSRLPPAPAKKAASRWRWALDFALIASVLLVLPVVARASPFMAGIVASSPLLLAASLVATQHQAGASGVLAVGRGAMGASLGVAAFVATAWVMSGATTPWLIAALGWTAFAAGVLIWNLFTPSWQTAAYPASAGGP